MFTNVPYIIIKYAKTTDNFIGSSEKQVWLTNNFSKRLVHKWRSEIDAILIGTNTAAIDNPELSTRFKFGKSPIRIVLDKKLRLKTNLKVFSGKQRTIVFTQKKTSKKLKNVEFYFLEHWNSEGIVEALQKLKIKSIIIEGGAQTIQSFLDTGLWNEARVFTAPKKLISGIPAPKINKHVKEFYHLDNDLLEIFENQTTSG